MPALPRGATWQQCRKTMVRRNNVGMHPTESGWRNDLPAAQADSLNIACDWPARLARLRDSSIINEEALEAQENIVLAIPYSLLRRGHPTGLQHQKT